MTGALTMLTVSSCGWLLVQLGCVTFVLDAHAADVALDHLSRKAAELGREVHIGAQLRRVLPADRRHVDGVDDRAVQQEIGDLLGDLERHVLLGFRRRGTEMRRRDHVVAAEQEILLGRLDREHVECRTGDVP
jgi:hypothetical protein